MKLRDLNEKLNSFKTFVNYFEVIKTKFKEGKISVEEFIDYNISLYNRRYAFTNLFYKFEEVFTTELNFNRKNLYELLNY